ncbi:MAG: hypothetical protein KJ884_06505 [Gammaproteobacteria bacterium]|nr:hypothetical protein [Gammaproteobacteria bacterium]MBU1492110.1 hypothetical protein [Gammaproteobacteria bacterium]MBU2139602.1 hypothetical protein [Gammaproteobacteria bacterium]MBU2218677.1 hypothetical protein [Gammaproteobacteria bacterium]MBU2322599.1 hypothetical protein [Gammaproteobacteria bacterium]
MHASYYSFALLMLAGEALAEACQVTTRPLSEQIPNVERQSCYEHQGMPADSIAWSCSNEQEQMHDVKKTRVPACPQGHVARCSAALTQASLANHNAAGEGDEQTLRIPDDARLVTYYYALDEVEQVRKECETSGGTWTP